jgi:hypothetical protein
MKKSLLAAGVAAAVLPAAASAQITGPSSSQSPYLLPVASAPGVQTVSLLTVGDSVGGYRLVGIPDGMGAYQRVPNARSFALLVNHELQSTSGIARAHGSTGAFNSFWGINRIDKSVFLGRDHTLSVVTTGSTSFGRFCSADMPARTAFFPNATAFSTEPYIFMNGEEIGAEGRAFAHVVTGPSARISYELPHFGKYSWENCVARPHPSPKTVVIGLDDSTPGQVYVYVGDKNPGATSVIEQAGLVGGTKYGVRVPGVPLEDRTNALNGVTTFTLANLGNVSGLTGAQLQTNSVAAGVTEFLRPEDGCWDPANPRDFYFLTTDRFNSGTTVGRSRLFRLRFNDVNDVTLGGQIDILLDGTEGQQMMDNMCIDRRGNLLIQEDPGNNAHLAKIWQYTIATDTLKLIAQHDPARFVTGGANFITQDEESSGIFDATDFFGPGWFIANVQAHATNPDPELVEGGQLLAIFNPDSQ